MSADLHDVDVERRAPVALDIPTRITANGAWLNRHPIAVWTRHASWRR